MGIRRVWIGALIGVTGVAVMALAVAPGRVGAAVHWVYKDLPAVSRHEWLTQKLASAGRMAGPVVEPAPAPVPAPVPRPQLHPQPFPEPGTKHEPQTAPEPEPTPPPAPAPIPGPAPAPTPAPGTAGIGAQPLRRVAVGEKPVVLTFDDGPSLYTQQLANILKAEQIPAAFFWIGANTEPGQPAELTGQGFQLGSHTMTHARMTTLTPDGQRSELSGSVKALGEVSYFRPPFGAYSPEVIQSAKALGLTTVMWDVDSRDWELGQHPEQIVPNVMSHVRSGSIILLHERPQTVKVLPELIKALRAAGYSFTALPVLN